MSEQKPLVWKIPPGATHVEIGWNETKGKPTAKFRKAKSESKPADDKKSDDGKNKPGVSEHLKSLFTGKGNGMFADDQDPIDVDDDDNEGDDDND